MCAVWLTPGGGWEEKYGGWPVVKKLGYVDNLVRRIGGQPSINAARERPPWSAARMTSTLAAHYERKRKALGSEFQGFYDDSLETLFSSGGGSSACLKASRFLRQHRRQLVDSVCRWTGHRKYDIHQLFSTLITRCDSLDLYAKPSETDNIIGLTALLTAIAGNTFKPLGMHKRR